MWVWVEGYHEHLVTWHSMLSNTQVLGDGLPEVYRLLKQVERGEMDELTRAHAQAALGELDTIMRQLLFPQQTLAKKITVLDKLWPCCLWCTSIVAGMQGRESSWAYCWTLWLYISEQSFFTELWISLFPCRPWPAASLIPRPTHTWGSGNETTYSLVPRLKEEEKGT